MNQLGCHGANDVRHRMNPSSIKSTTGKNQSVESNSRDAATRMGAYEIVSPNPPSAFSHQIINRITIIMIGNEWNSH